MRALVLLLGVALAGPTLAQSPAPPPTAKPTAIKRLPQAKPAAPARPETLQSSNERGNAEMIRARLKDVKILGPKNGQPGKVEGLSPAAIEVLRNAQTERARTGETLSSPFKLRTAGMDGSGQLNRARKGIRANEVTVTEWMGLVRRAAHSAGRAAAMRRPLMPGVVGPRALTERTGTVGRKPIIGKPTIGKRIGATGGGKSPRFQPRIGLKPQP